MPGKTEGIPAEIHIIKSNRKSTSVRVMPDNIVEVRTSLTASDEYIEEFLSKHREWILERLEENKSHSDEPKMTEAEIRALANRALEYIPKRVEYYAPIIGVKFGRITIRNQITKWGSCSAKGNLNFNCLLMLTPPEVIDSVVVHELCHLKYMNHSNDFYSEVLRYFPDYDKCDAWLKENGRYLLARML